MATALDPTTPRQHLDRRFDALKSERSSWESEWRDQQDFIAPGRGRWLTSETNKGGRRNRKIYDNTAGYAARTLASGLMAGITSPSRPWFKLTTPDPAMMQLNSVKLWLEEVEERMAGMFANSNIYNVLANQYEELGIFGNAPILLYEDRIDIIRAYGLTIGEYVVGSDDRDEVNTLGREMQWTVGQAAKRFGLNKLCTASQNLYNRGNLEAPITIRHIIEPNNEYRPGMLGHRGKAWRSVWWEVGAPKHYDVLAVEGFDSKPFMVPRWKVIGRDAYGRGPGADVLGDVISLQSMTKKKARAVDKQIDPPMNLPGAMKNTTGYSLDPGTNNFVDGMGAGVNATPAQQVTPNLSHFVADIQEIQERIKRGLYEDLFLMIHQLERGQITATEIIERKAEKLIGLGPVVERLNDELLEPLIDRAFDIMMSAKDAEGNPLLVSPPPEELQGIKIEVEFMSIFRQAQEQEDVTRTIGYVQNLALMTQATADPSVMDNLDVDEAAQILGNKGGAPAKVIASVEKRDAKRKARADAEQQMQAAQMSAQAVEAAKALGQTSLAPENALGAMMGV